MAEGEGRAVMCSCPNCGTTPFQPFLRFFVERSDWRWIFRALWALVRGRPVPPVQTCLICWTCKEIVGYEP